MKPSAGLEVHGLTNSHIITAPEHIGIPVKAHVVWKDMVVSGVKPVPATLTAITRGPAFPLGGNSDVSLAKFTGVRLRLGNQGMRQGRAVEGSGRRCPTNGQLRRRARLLHLHGCE